METLLNIWEKIRPHMAGLGLAATWFGIAFVYWRRRSDWRSKRFSGIVNFSLNYVDDNKLQMRTLVETTTAAVWQNEYGVKLVLRASAKTRPDQPFIVLKDPADMHYVKRAVLNVLSARFPEMFLGKRLGAPIRHATFIYAVTFENYPDMRTRKFRVLLVEESSLQKDFGSQASTLQKDFTTMQAPTLGVEQPSHRDRIAVLQTMARLAAQPTHTVEGAEVLGRVELGVLA